MENNLTEKDLRILKRLVVISRSILNNYYLLINLENSSQKDHDEYDKIVKELEINLEMEEELYSLIDSFEKVKYYLAYLNNINQGIFENYLYIIFDDDSEELIQSRITSHLEYLMDTKEFTEDNNDDIYETDDNVEEEMNELDLDIEKIMALNKIQISIENDIIKTIIKLIDEYIMNDNYKIIKYDLIRYKYMLIFMFGEIERELIKSNYNNKDLNWSHLFVGDYYGLEDWFLKKQEDDYSIDLLTEARDVLLSVVDSDIERIEDIKNSDYYIDITIYSIFMRACLLFISKDLAEQFINILRKDINEIERKNETVVPIVEQIINNYHIDTELPNILRLKK